MCIIEDEINQRKLELYEEIKPFIECVFFSGNVRFRDEAERLVNLMQEIDEIVSTKPDVKPTLSEGWRKAW